MLDPSGYLSSFGWKGQGNGLRHGSVSRPLSIPQKRTLAGLGKDRDEAFPFWDHLFAAAAKSINIKVSGDKARIETVSTAQSPLLRTMTGILSSRPPIVGTPATSRTATPSDSPNQCTKPRLGLAAMAKRDNARKLLYSAFFRGPVLGQDADPEKTVLETQCSPPLLDQGLNEQSQSEISKGKKKRKHKGFSDEKEGERKKQRHLDLEALVGERSKMMATQDTHEEEDHRMPKRKGKKQDATKIAKMVVESPEDECKRKAAKVERKKLKEERLKSKEARRNTQ